MKIKNQYKCKQPEIEGDEPLWLKGTKESFKLKNETKFITNKENSSYLDNIKSDLIEHVDNHLLHVYHYLEQHLNYWLERTTLEPNEKAKDKIKFVARTAKKPAYIELKIHSLNNPSGDRGVVFKIMLLVKGSKPYIKVEFTDECEDQNHSNIFKFDILKKNFINMLMAWFNDNTKMLRFNVTNKQYNYAKYIESRLNFLY